MIESISNTVQMICLAISVAFSTFKYFKSFKREWLLLALSGGAFFLGDLYYQLFLTFYGHTPHYSSIPDFSWSASFLSLLILIVIQSGEHFSKPRSIFMWLIPAFCLAMCVFFVWITEYYVSNITSSALMCLIIWHTVSAVLHGKETSVPEDDPLKKGRFLYVVILVFAAAEYLGWTISCYWMGDTLLNPYFWSDSAISVIFLIFPAALKKAVSE